LKIQVKRAFFMGGVVQEVGSFLEVNDKLARELCAMNKADPAGAMPAQSGPMTTETAAVVVKGKAAKEQPHAG
jgi:hypothetical protein